MHILVLAHAFNSLSQRLFCELRERGHTVSVELDINDSVTREAVALFRPDLVLAPFLKRAIPETVWRRIPCLVVHPGPRGDSGPSALDWAVLKGERTWGVTVLQAEAEMEAGPVWASSRFPIREAPKGSLYRREVTDAAVAGVMVAIEALQKGGIRPKPQGIGRPGSEDVARSTMCQADRRIDWRGESTESVLRKIRSADGEPGVLDEIEGRPVYLFDAHAESRLAGRPGTLITRRHGTVCRATADGAVWIGHMKERSDTPTFKLPSTMVLGDLADRLPEAPPHAGQTYRDIWYEEEAEVGYLHFPFYNGAMSTAQCERLRQAFHRARSRPTRVIVLMGGSDFWSNGLHLNVIEVAANPAEESWRNINAMDDLIRDIVTATDRYVIAAVRGNAGAGGVFMALAADRVVARNGVILNPHYEAMGNLHRSEYWTYLVPKRSGGEVARMVTEARLPITTVEAESLGLVDENLAADADAFDDRIRQQAAALARDPALSRLLREKARRLAADEAEKSLCAYRAEALKHMRLNLFDPDSRYHVARHNFVYKVPKSRTPLTIALHRCHGTGRAARRFA